MQCREREGGREKARERGKVPPPSASTSSNRIKREKGKGQANGFHFLSPCIGSIDVYYTSTRTYLSMYIWGIPNIYKNNIIDTPYVSIHRFDQPSACCCLESFEGDYFCPIYFVLPTGSDLDCRIHQIGGNLSFLYYNITCS